MIARRAMTLIELLVSLALLGMLALLASLAWGQLRAWNDDADRARDALRPHRVYAMLARQWDARPPADEESLPGRPYGASDAISFTTRRAVRYPGWPLVEASYVIEPASETRPARLLYDERRLGPNAETVPVTETASPLVLLERVTDSRVRFRARVTREQAGEEIVEELWLDSVEPGINESVELLYAELLASAKGEDIRWVGIVEPLR